MSNVDQKRKLSLERGQMWLFWWVILSILPSLRSLFHVSRLRHVNQEPDLSSLISIGPFCMLLCKVCMGWKLGHPSATAIRVNCNGRKICIETGLCTFPCLPLAARHGRNRYKDTCKYFSLFFYKPTHTRQFSRPRPALKKAPLFPEQVHVYACLCNG